MPAAASAAGRLADGGYTVVFDGVIGPPSLGPFITAAGAVDVHYAMLLPPEEVCLERVNARIGHGFKDLQAARHMYSDFEGAAGSGLCVDRSIDPPELITTRIAVLFGSGALRIPTALP